MYFFKTLVSTNTINIRKMNLIGFSGRINGVKFLRIITVWVFVWSFRRDKNGGRKNVTVSEFIL